MFKVDSKFKNAVVSAKGLQIVMKEATQEQLELLFNLGHVGVIDAGKVKRKPKAQDNAEGEPLPEKPKDE